MLQIYYSPRAITWRREAYIEFGDDIASTLKLTKDGTKILWPQPYDDARDPQNVSHSFVKNLAFSNDMFISGAIEERMLNF